MFFFFKQKTAYDMRISDWSSGVCSSDRGGVGTVSAHEAACTAARAAEDREDDPVPPQGGAALPDPDGEEGNALASRAEQQQQDRLEIGRVSARERGCQYV